MKYSYVLEDTCGACSAIKNHLEEHSISHFFKNETPPSGHTSHIQNQQLALLSSRTIPASEMKKNP